MRIEIMPASPLALDLNIVMVGDQSGKMQLLSVAPFGTPFHFDTEPKSDGVQQRISHGGEFPCEHTEFSLRRP